MSGNFKKVNFSDNLPFENIPLTEFDKDRFALLEPVKLSGGSVLPESCVFSFHYWVIEKLLQIGRLDKIVECRPVLLPYCVFRLQHKGKSVAVAAPPGCGAPMAAALMEDLIASGCRKIVAFGSAGVLKPELKRGDIVIPDSAIRDEGTSFHYLPPSRTLNADPLMISKMEEVLKGHQIEYEVGLTWTTDAPYRETRGKIARRKAEGCLTVEMEFSALLAVARFRKVSFGQYLLAGDDLSGEKWEEREWTEKTPGQEKLFWLAVEAALSL